MFEINSFQVPNSLVDEYLPQLNGNDLKVLLVIIRKTKGWNKEYDGISISQFQKFTGIKDERTIKKSLKKLINLKLIEKIEQAGTYSLFRIIPPAKNEGGQKMEGVQKMSPLPPAKNEGTPPAKNAPHNNTLPKYTNTKNTNNIKTHASDFYKLYEEAIVRIDIKDLLNSLKVDDSFLLDLLAYRKQIDQPIKTIQGVIGLLKKFQNVIVTTPYNPQEAFEIMRENEWKTPDAIVKQYRAKRNNFSKLEQKQINTLRAVENFIKGGLND